MPDTRSHRGPAPEDARLFGPEALPALHAAVTDLTWLLDRGYAEPSALKIVGDRHRLDQRQRTAVLRCTCTTDAATARREREVRAKRLQGATVSIDTYNVLITVEAAMGGGALLIGADRCVRDMASVHGTFRTVAETVPALALLGECLQEWGVSRCRWYLDSPVSNSGRLATRMGEVAEERSWPWTVALVPGVDRELTQADDIVCTADSGILDAGVTWFNLARRVVEERVPGARPIDLSPSSRP